MRAVVMHENGGPDVLRLERVPEPVAGEGEVLVHVDAAGVNRYDLAQRAGAAKPGTILGLDAVGWVGDPEHETRSQRVLVTGAPGTYAELVAVKEQHVFSIPDTLSSEVGAALGVPYRTAWHALELGGVEEGSRVLVQAGSSATGQAAIDVARARGATVFATASIEKLERIRELGAEPLPYGDPKLAEVEADVVFDPVGGESLGHSLAALARGGRIVTPGALGDAQATIDVWALVGRAARLIGIGSAPLERDTMQELIDRAAHGELTPVIDRELPLERAAEAHRAIEARETFGKVILRP
jgi:NADPH:quinone reductase-like Zn-dependent oxidoreductase